MRDRARTNTKRLKFAERLAGPLASDCAILIRASDYMNDPDEFRWASRLGKNHLEELGAGKEEIAEFDRMIESQPFKDSYIWSFTKNSEIYDSLRKG